MIHASSIDHVLFGAIFAMAVATVMGLGAVVWGFVLDRRAHRRRPAAAASASIPRQRVHTSRLVHR